MSRESMKMLPTGEDYRNYAITIGLLVLLRWYSVD